MSIFTKMRITPPLWRVRLLLIAVMFIASLTSISAHSAKLSGVVHDTDGEAIIGATVMVEGTTRGTTTDMNGKFQIQVSPKDKISVSFLGYVTHTFTAGAKSKAVITLNDDNKTLDDIVVVGYGQQKKANLVGAVASVGGKDIESITTPDVVNSLAGRAAGVRIAQFSSEPGTYDTNIDIRGMGTPLIIIDGAERTQAEFSRMSSTEIESISILKDASAAIYGVQAANGVVLVTTKQGKRQAPKVSYTGRFGVQAVTEFMEHASALEYGEMYNEITFNSYIKSRRYFEYEDEIWQSLRYDKEYFEKCLSGEIKTYSYLDLIMNDYATQQQHSLSINGGAERMTYFFNAGYYNEGGLYKNDILNSDKINARMNLNITLSRDLKFLVNVGYINTLRKSPSQSIFNIFKAATTYPVNNAPYANDNPEYLSTSEYNLNNPLAMIDESMSGSTNTNEKFLQSNFELQYSVPYVKGLMLKARFSYDYNNSVVNIYNKSYNLYDYIADTDTYRAYLYNSPSTVTNTVNERSNFNTQLSANYNKKIKRHTLNLLALFENRYITSGYNSGSTHLAIDNIPELSAGLPSTSQVNSNKLEIAKLSYVGRINYNFASKYFLELTARVDGSSKFPTDNRWGVFPSVLAAWRFSEERFAKNYMQWLSNGKLRVSYGIMGDDGAANSQYLAGYTYPSGNITGLNALSNITGGYLMGDEWVPSLGVRDIANEDLTWYTSRTFNVGLDLSFFNNKLYSEIDYFSRERSGLLAFKTQSDPYYVGASLPQENLNGDITSGYEFMLGYRSNFRKLKYNVSGNVSYSRTMWTHFEESQQPTSYEEWHNKKSDRYADIVWGYETNGVYQTFEEIAKAPLMDGMANRSILPGTYRYVDQNGDGVIDSDDARPIGSGGINKPLFSYAINIDLSYQNWGFKMLWQGTAKNLVRYNENPLQQPFAFGYASPLKEMTSRWHCVNYDDPYSSKSWVAGDYPAVGSPMAIDGYFADQCYFEASYLRLKSVEVSYQIPKKVLKKTKLDQCRLYVSAYNLLTLSNGFKFLDPEFNSGRNYTYPVTFNVNAGIDLTF